MKLSARQIEILRCIAAGDGDKEIASRLGVSVRTVRTHLERIFDANGVRTRASAVALWLRTTPGGEGEPADRLGSAES